MLLLRMVEFLLEMYQRGQGRPNFGLVSSGLWRKCDCMVCGYERADVNTYLLALCITLFKILSYCRARLH